MGNSNSYNKKMSNSKDGFIICGTDTNVGKTLISAFLVQGLNATYWKPIQSGFEDGGDTFQISKILNLNKNRIIDEVYKLNTPVSPHWAAEIDNILIDQKHLKMPDHQNTIILETAGGVMVPLRRNLLQIDQIKEWGLPVILIVRSGLGTLNHTFLTLESLRKRSIEIAGIIINGPKHKDNPKTIQEISDTNIIAEFPQLEFITAEILAKEWERQNLTKIFNELLNPKQSNV